ncbi:hypothetical protein NUW58_g923 [Xylaria curta]|uniref:Uncharacterized protein n=1 Tax=Xylaria curta TaxID=42375 RepID=A0ACC1PNE6_9PEZI|nr:hypothetical protein NUW58_g923 [Xylaria curta]
MTLGSHEWFQAQQRARDAYPALVEGYPEWKILNTLVENPNASVTNAVEQMLSLAPAELASERPAVLGDHPYHIFLSLIEIAKRTPPEGQAKLVQFVARLQKNALINEATGQPLRHEGYLVWTQLPALGYTAADEWGSIVVLDDSLPPDQLRHYENLIALLAQLSAAADVDYNDPVVGEMDFSFWSMRAFKEAFTPGEGHLVPTNEALRVASLWLIYATDRLWANIKYGRVFGRRGNDPGTVMTAEMWDKWQHGLSVAKTTCNDEETLGLITSALRHMEQVAMQGSG